MAGGKAYGSSDLTALLQNENLPCSSEVLNSLWVPTSSSPFLGSSSMVSFENGGGADEREEDDYDGCFLPPCKKRRLSVEQVQFLEKSFEAENKLEPERKVQLAKEVGLQPRQVTIWFQNRKARFKTKQLEKDYDSLKSSFDQLQSEYDNLVKETDKLKQEVLFLKDKLLIRDDEDIRAWKHLPKTVSENGPPPEPEPDAVAPTMLVCKQEDASSAKSDVVDSDSPHYTTQSNSLLEPTADSSNVLESDEDDDNFSRRFLPAPSSYLSKLEDGLFQHPHAGSCNFGFQVEDQLFCFWP